MLDFRHCLSKDIDLFGHGAQGTMVTALNAVSNSSRTPVSESQILAILATGDGPGHLVRALFGDCSFETLDRLGAEHGVSRATIRQAYAHGRAAHAAVNEDME